MSYLFNTMPSVESGGTIRTSRFVKPGAAAREALEADAGERTFGISQEGTHDRPQAGVTDDTAASDGEHLLIYGPLASSVLLKLGSGGCSAWDHLTPDADGKGVVATSGDIVGAVALEAGAEDEKVPVWILGYNGFAEPA